MKPFYVFCGYNYYPSGGWADFAGSFETLEGANRWLVNYTSRDWYHIVDIRENRIVQTG